jgi:hypothetical protein
MPLDPAGLTASLTQAFQSFPATAKAAADLMASAYNTYALAATAGTALPVLTGAEEATLSAALLPALASPQTGSSASLAAAWTAAITGFWLSPPVVFTGVPDSGVPTVIAGIGALTSTLSALLSSPTNTAPVAASGLASALDTVTRTVTVPLQPSGLVVTLL